jgi:hypothetical protein
MICFLIHKTGTEAMTCRWGFCGAGLICNDFAAAIATHIDNSNDDKKHELTAVAARWFKISIVE